MDMNITEISGNLSYAVVVGAFAMTDILALRVASIGATLLALVFQYYRKAPLWISIRWSFFLLLINSYMATELYLERKRANEMSEDLEALYRDGFFEVRGFSKVEFLRFYDLATTVSLPANHVMVKQGEP